MGGGRGLNLRLRNNIVQQNGGEIYIDGNKSQINGDKNLWFGNLTFGAGSGPSQTQNNINADPQFVNMGAADFHLRSSSPAKDAGAAIAPNNPLVPGSAQPTDKDGVARPQGKAFDLGAYEMPN